ncbi:MAG: hypothetical protein DRI56_07000 [Chloroflexota bacterium]|nr:MAG: hypothetical protein DRI56_07000 [Chloroflexota bacterium]
MLAMRKIFLFILIFSATVGCAANATSTVTPPIAPSPTPEPIVVAVSPVLGNFWGEILRACAWGQPQTLLLTEEAASLYPDVSNADLTLWWGNPNDYPLLSEPGVFATSLGEESLVIIVHQDNPLTSLTAQNLQDIYSAQVQTWRQVTAQNALGEIQVWIYPNAHPLRHAFDQVILPQENLTSYAHLAPSPEAMLEAVRENPSAIGYVPRQFLIAGTNVKEIPLQPRSEGFRQPILGIAAEEPGGNLAELLLCLQINFP